MTNEETSNTPLTCWFILREEIQYSSQRLLDIAIKSITKPFHHEHLRDEWVNSGSNFKTYMMFNINFLDKLENNLIEGGFMFKWIYLNDVLAGIMIEPTRENFRETLLYDCMSLEEYAENRLKEFNELSSKRKVLDN